MNFRLICYYLSSVCTFLAVAMGTCCLFAIPWLGHRTDAQWEELKFESDGFLGLLGSVAVSLIVGAVLRRLSHGASNREAPFRKEAMAVVGLSWLIATLLGALPFWLSGVRYAPPVRLDSPDHVEVFDSSFALRQQWRTLHQRLADDEFAVLSALVEADQPSVGMTVAELQKATNRSNCLEISQRLSRISGLGEWLVIPDSEDAPVRLKWLSMELATSIFESQSGFSTTGATVINKLEDPGLVPHSILFWRSTTHLLGGLGIIVLFVVLLGGSSAGKMLMKAEMAGPTKDGSTPRMQRTAWRFGVFYLVLNAVLTGLLLICGMNLFDSLCHAFGTMATGGFSTYDASIGHFDSATIDTVITLFMIAAGTNFALFYALVVLDKRGQDVWMWVKGKLARVLGDTEFRAYMGIILLATIAIMASGMVHGDWELTGPSAADDTVGAKLVRSLRYGLFQVVAIVTTTGYGTHDFNTWSEWGRCLMFGLMFIGGCAGSTGGGMKVIRHVLFVKILGNEVEHVYHPSVVRPLTLGGVTYDDQEMRRSILVYFGLITILFMASWLAIVALEPDSTWPVDQEGHKLMDSASAVAATLNNIGPGLGIVGATSNYSDFSPTSKFIFTWLMMLGRLELFSILVLFSVPFWTRPR